MSELTEAQLEQLKILTHSNKINYSINERFSPFKLETIVTTLRNSSYFDPLNNIVTITNEQINSIFKDANITDHEVLITLGRNKMPYKKYKYRPKINKRQITLYNIYQILLI